MRRPARARRGDHGSTISGLASTVTPVKNFSPVSFTTSGGVMADHGQANGRLPVEVICVPWSVGLRPDAGGAEPGTWSAPRALREAGLSQRLGAVAVTELPRPPYQVEA